MKNLIFLFIISFSLLIFQCSNEIPTTNDPINLELGKVSLRIDKENAPDEVVLVEAFLTRQGLALYGELNILDSTSADILFENVPVGEWHLKVDAKDSSGVVLYTGETDITVLAGILTQVNLTLVPTGSGTGSIYIFVSWGTSSNSQWEQINSPTQSNLNCVYVVTSLVSFIGGDNGKVFKTLNGGISWQDISPQTSVGFYSIYFVDENHGWVGGREGTIARTTDGGNSWNINSVYSSSIHNIVESMYFFDNNIGYITGGFSLPDRQTFIYKTTNGGASWNLQLNLFGGILFEFSFIDQNNGFVVGTNGGVFKTTNGGNTWESCFVNTGYWLRAAYFFDMENGVVMGQGGQAWRTVNGGNSWSFINTNISNWIESVAFTDLLNGWAVGTDGSGIVSTDGGSTWTKSPFPTSNYLYSVNFSDGNYGLVVGFNGTIFRSNFSN